MSRRSVKLTERIIDRLPAPDPSGKQVLHWDSALKGFGILCSGVSNSKTYIVQRTLPDGRTRRVTIAAVNELALADARDEAAAKLVELRKGNDPKARAATLQSTLDAYLKKKADKLSNNSKLNYRSMVEKHLASWLNKPLNQITRQAVAERHAGIARDIAAAGKGKGETSANATMRAFRLLWNFAAKSDATLPANPVDHLRGDWFKEHRRDRIVGRTEMSAFHSALVALQNDVAGDYLRFILFTGLRRREAAMLKWEHVDFAKELIRIPAANTKANRKLDLPMVDVVRELLEARRAVGKELSGYVFASHGKAGYIAEPKSPLEAVGKACGVYVSVHDLRRTYITIAEETEISSMALKALVNHALGIDVTEGYVQMNPERLRSPAQKVADRLKELCGISLPEESSMRNPAE